MVKVAAIGAWDARQHVVLADVVEPAARFIVLPLLVGPTTCWLDRSGTCETPRQDAAGDGASSARHMQV